MRHGRVVHAAFHESEQAPKTARHSVEELVTCSECARGLADNVRLLERVHDEQPDEMLRENVVGALDLAAASNFP